MPPEKSIRERDPDALYTPPDKEDGEEHASESASVHNVQPDAAPLTQVSGYIHTHFGNALMQSALSGGQDPLSAVLGAETVLSAAGMGGTELASNGQMGAMLEAMGPDGAAGGDVMMSRDAAGSGVIDPGQAAALIARSRGQRLPEAVAMRLSTALGVDISHARIHTDTAAQKAADAVHAKAFAVGQDVFFGAGKYQPGTSQGDELLLHELTHVVQDAEGRIPTVAGGEGVSVSSPTDAHEREAESAAREAVGMLHGTDALSDLDLSTAVEGAGEDQEVSSGQVAGGLVSREYENDRIIVEFLSDEALVHIFTVVGGMHEDEARGLLMGQQASPHTDGEPRGPDLAERDRGRAFPLDMEEPASEGHIDPANPGLADSEQVYEMPLMQIFELHRDNLLHSELGHMIDFHQLDQAMAMADSLHQFEVVDAIHAFKFRIEQYAWLEVFNVEESGRYQRTPDKTFCNIYAYDMIRAMGAYIPRVFWDEPALSRIEAGAIVVTAEEWAGLGPEARRTHIAPIYDQTVREINTNTMTGWMDDYGAEFGWAKAVDMTEAQEMANAGHPVFILAGKVRNEGSGHISIVLAEDENNQAQRDEESGEVLHPIQSNAGGTNAKVGYGASRGGEWWNARNYRDGHAWYHVGAGTPPIPLPENYE